MPRGTPDYFVPHADSSYPIPKSETYTDFDYIFTAAQGTATLTTLNPSATIDAVVRAVVSTLKKSAGYPIYPYNGDIYLIISTGTGSVIVNDHLVANSRHVVGPSSSNNYYISRTWNVRDVLVKANQQVYSSIIFNGITVGSVLTLGFNYIFEYDT